MDIKLKQGDFRQLSQELPDSSVDLICTDPPWLMKFMPLYEDLGAVAKRVLKPGGFLAAYCGQGTMADALDRLRRNLDYYWIVTFQHGGKATKREAEKVFTGGHVVLIFQKPPRTKPPGWIYDLTLGGKFRKSNYGWEQPEIESRKLIGMLSRPGELVLDPFAGSGTTLLSADSLNRHGIGFEIHQEYIDIYNKRNLRIDSIK